MHIAQYDGDAGRQLVHGGEEQAPAQHHQGTGGQHPGGGGPHKTQMTRLPAQHDPRCQTGQTECTAKPRFRQRIRLCVVHEHANSPEQRVAKQEGRHAARHARHDNA
jgi:hypothetical protein